VGTRREIAAHIGPETRVLDLAGGVAYPGFIEGHAHFTQLGRARQMLDLSQARSWEEIVDLVGDAAKATAAGTWIIGRGWHQEKWTEPPTPVVESYPTHAALSEAVPRHPVLLSHASGHLCLANQRAMRLAGVDRSTPDPSGGEILRDGRGSPTGVFRENAQDLIQGAVTRVGRGEMTLDAMIDAAGRECLRKGITSFHDAGSSFAVIDRFRQRAAEGRLPVRLWVMISENNDRLARYLPTYRMVGYGEHFLTVRAIKRFADGALGSHGAWLLEPYADLPHSRGLQTTRLESLRATAQLAVRHEMQLCIHAIGDRANREVLDLYEEVSRTEPANASRRWRIEHAQHLDPADVPRFAELGVIAAMQGIHCTSDAVFVPERLGAARSREGAYVWQSLLQSGATVVNGTDAPVEDVDPIACFHASVTRRLPDGSSFYPEQAMTRDQALRSYTIDAAHAAYEEDLKGTLTPGKLADIVVLSQDLLTCPEPAILSTRVQHTIVGGSVAYSSVPGSRDE
jgi:predicted amidohydrolase YtcJ